MVSAREMKTNLIFLEYYWTFHRSLVAFSENDLLVQSWNAITAMFGLFLSKSSSHFADSREVIHTTEGFLHCFRAGDAEQAERVVRSMIVWMGYVLLDARIPKDVSGYVTHVIGPDLAVVAIDPAELSARLRQDSPSPRTRKEPRRRSKIELVHATKHAS
jgi:hypothetical protein